MTPEELADSDDYRALLRGVLTDPADDLPRLIFADFLDENGDDRAAELIRVQCEIASFRWAKGGVCLVPGFAPPPELRRLVELQRRERALEPGSRITTRGFSTAFVVSVDPHGGMHGLPHAALARGLVASIRLTTAAFLGHAAALFSRHPIVSVTLSDRRPFDTPGRPASYDWAMDPARDSAVSETAPHVLPKELFYRLTTPDADWGGGAASYFGGDARARALAALSAACVGYGRELAGLPPIPAAEVPA